MAPLGNRADAAALELFPIVKLGKPRNRVGRRPAVGCLRSGGRRVQPARCRANAPSRPGRPIATMRRGLFYFGLAYVPAAYLAGNHSVGSDQQQRRTAARLLFRPGGQELVAVVGTGPRALTVSWRRWRATAGEAQ